MISESKHLDDLKDIKSIMQKSSRFSSLSGWSGILAGIIAFAGAWYIAIKVPCWSNGTCDFSSLGANEIAELNFSILFIAIAVFTTAALLTVLLTYLRTRKTGTTIWNYTTRRLLINLAVPLIVGGIFIYKMMSLGWYELLLPASIIFYGLSLVNAGKYTLTEVKYLGYGQLVIGVISCWATTYGLYFWALGFGLLHIIYGTVMWYKYERS